VEASCAWIASSSPSIAGAICSASCFPSSTPHWSNELMPHTTPCVNVMCSYSAISSPSTLGVSDCPMMDVVGLLPGNVRAATSAPVVPSASTSSAVLPNASAFVCARKFARNNPCTSRSPSLSGYAGSANAMKSAGMSRVPWWISW
jgi:hypothetical protein